LLLARDRLPLRASLAALGALARVAEVRGPWSDWAGDVLGLQGAELRRWSRRAWWGREASHAMRLRLDDARRCRGAEALILPVDWRRLDALRGRGGVLLAGAHIGPSQAAAHCVARHCPDALFLFWNPHPGVTGAARLLAEPEARRWALVEAWQRLRDGGVVFWAADAGGAVRPLAVEMFGRPVRLSCAAATLARLSGAASLPIAAVWDAGRIRVVTGDPLDPGTAGPEAWERQWLASYARFLQGQISADAANLRLDVGLSMALFTLG
jgi:hypothetical protein